MSGNSAGPPQAPLVAIGVDGARGGWVAACLYGNSLHEEDAAGWQSRPQLFPTVQDLAVFRNAAGSNAAVTIDVPMACSTPSTSAPATSKLANCWASAATPCSRHRRGTWSRLRTTTTQSADSSTRSGRPTPRPRGLSPYAAGITPKVKEVDDWVRAHRESEEWLVECHPELCFQALPRERYRRRRRRRPG
jgi:predicted RNase H-like nuclease